MSRKLSILGVVLTAAYAWLLYFIFDGRIVESLSMKPNEIGDLLAGMFGPLTILWLILGFFQQGIELRQNTAALKLQEEALRAQVQELVHSVEQQRDLVKVSREQVELAAAALQEERRKSHAAAQPKFVFDGCGSMTTGGLTTYRSAVRNVGSLATQVQFIFGPEVHQSSLGLVHLWPSGEVKELNWNYRTAFIEEAARLKIHYRDGNGNEGEKIFEFLPESIPGSDRKSPRIEEFFE